MEKVKCAVLGATGVVGQNFLKLLVDHPYFELTTVCASDARKGQKLGEVKEHVPGGIPAAFSELIFEAMDVNVLLSHGIQIVFSALPASTATGIEREAAKAGIKVFSNASAYRMHPQVPILIPEINYPHLDIVKSQQKETDGFIVTNANCTTTGLVLGLAPFLSLNIKKLVVASCQAVSGAGYPGLSILDISNNVIPYIAGEEPKMLNESAKICGKFDGAKIVPVDWDIYAHCVRVQTIIGHLISVHIELDEKMNRDDVKNLIEQFSSPEILAGLPTAPVRPVIFTDAPDRPQPRYDIEAGTPERAKGMAAIIGRLEVRDNVIRFITLSNNLVRGAAGGSVLNAELAFRKNMI